MGWEIVFARAAKLEKRKRELRFRAAKEDGGKDVPKK